MWGSYREEEEIDSGYCSCVIAINCFLTRGAKDLEFSKLDEEISICFFLLYFVSLLVKRYSTWNLVKKYDSARIVFQRG